MNKAYPQFNLKTLQLPAPASSMTKDEYREAYGIDLDDTNIKAFKLVLLGNEKFPIDQIKEVEDGYEIYFNGNVLSITDNVQTFEEVYGVENAKPIYFHPISINDAGGSATTKYKISFIILNNDPTPFTIESFKSYIDSIYNSVGESVRFICNGAYYDGSNVGITSYLGIRSTGYFIYGTNASTGASYEVSNVNFDGLIPANSYFFDGVNKIN